MTSRPNATGDAVRPYFDDGQVALHLDLCVQRLSKPLQPSLFGA